MIKEHTPAPPRAVHSPLKETPTRASGLETENSGNAAALLLPLQRSIGNRAVAAMFAGTIQRDVEPYQNNTGGDLLPSIAGQANDAVKFAVSLIAANPFLTSVEGSDKGYLKSWVTTFTKFYNSPGEIPKFFYARYGYAVETIACNILKTTKISPFEFVFQVSHGHTRPDIVVKNGKAEVGWLDITSSASKGHILNKQGAGWSSRPYVAEITYDMPTPATLLTSSTTIDPQVLLKLAEATKKAEEDERAFEKGRQAIATYIASAFFDKIQVRGEGLSKTLIKELVVEVCRKYIDADMPPKVAAGVLAQLEELEILPDNEPENGMNLARYAFGDPIRYKDAEFSLMKYGYSLK